MNSHHANTPGTTRGPVRRGRASFDEDVFGGTEDTHVFSVVLLERPPAERQRAQLCQRYREPLWSRCCTGGPQGSVAGPRQCFSNCGRAHSVSSF